MSPIERRVEILRLTKPGGVSIPDMAMWLDMADELEVWVLAASDNPDGPDNKRQRTKGPKLSPDKAS